MMSSELVSLTTRSQIYDPPLEKNTDNAQTDKTYSPIPSPTNGIQIKKHVLDTILRPPKSTIWKSVFNPYVHSAKYYNVVEYLAQAPYAMSTLEVVQTCPTQRKNLLSVLGAMDPENSNIITFKMKNFKSQLFHQLSLQLSTKFIGKIIRRTILDKGS